MASGEALGFANDDNRTVTGSKTAGAQADRLPSGEPTLKPLPPE
jgi:hypothetical protein